MILEVTGEQIALLNDTDLRTLVGYLCERELRAHGHSPSAVTWGGHQNAGDGGIDVRVALAAGVAISGYVPKSDVGFQVKAQDMPRAAILEEMAPKGVVLTSIARLAASGGAYIIASSLGSLSDTSLKNRKAAMSEAIKGLETASLLTLDFYDRRRIATWVNQHAGLVPWVRERLGLPLSGWRPFEDWSSSPAPVDAPYLLDAQTRLIGPSIKKVDGLAAEEALSMLRDILSKPKGIVRLVGLSGVGKTRLIQALFDDRIGVGALSRSDALYTDISDEPDPVPQEMLSRLIAMGDRVVLIVDNCGIELHRKLATKITDSQCSLSVVTVEYDISDDEPESTDIFRLEPASIGLIDKMLESRYPALAAPSRHVIGKFAEGNSRVAFALAETAKNGASLAKLSDSGLFERLFFQQKGPSAELLDAAKSCALLYSFDGETLEDGLSELAPLAKLVGQTVDQLHKHIAELHRRQLVQKRSKWRAILPHALANRLAKRALEDIPLRRIEDAIISGSPTRMLRSFSRRIGYLHDDERARALATKWLAMDGLLGQLGMLDAFKQDIFENIAPVSPIATLTFIEEAAKRSEDWFFSKRNENKTQIVRVIRSLAYDPALFERSAGLLQRFVLAETSGMRDSTGDSLKSLFSLYLSGTHASAAQRAAFVQKLLESSGATEMELGLILLERMLKTSNFMSNYSFEFGAWKRDFGLRPGNGDLVRDWYTHVIGTCKKVEKSGHGLAGRIRRIVANHVAQLLRVGMFDEVTELAMGFSRSEGWPEGWIGVRSALRRGKEMFPGTTYHRLEALELTLRPTDLAGLIRSYALSPEWGAVDIADLDDEAKLEPLQARQRVYEMCTDLGQQLAEDVGELNALLPEIFAADSRKTFALGQGLAEGSDSLMTCWNRLIDAFLKVPQDKQNAQFISGFLKNAMARSPEVADDLLDQVLADPRLHPHFLNWQVGAGINSRAYERLVTALALDTVPVWSFRSLAFGGAHEGLSDDELRLLLQRILGRYGGNSVAGEILGMRVFGKMSDKLPISDSLRAMGREFLEKVELEKSVRQDHLLGLVIEVAFDKPEYEPQVRDFCARLIVAFESWEVSASDLGEIITALTKSFPLVVLDQLVEQACSDGDRGQDIFPDIRSNRPCPLDSIADEVWIAWAEDRTESRYALLAQAFRFSNSSDDDPAEGWSPAAAKLIEVALEPAKVLDAFLKRFEPSGWSGSLADILASRLSLIEVLKGHPREEVSAWANENFRAFAARVDHQRANEATENRARDQTFE